MKSQTDFTSPFSSIKGKIQQKYFNGKYPHTIWHTIWLRIRRENRLYLNFSGVIDITETISAVSLTPLKQFQRCH
jgi:hypothetical protein